MSVQALSGDFVDGRGLSSIYELQFDVPGLVVNNRGMFGAGVALRGITDEGGASLAIAPHFDGVYLGRSNLFLTRMFDVERVEVVKGPQGTLYGRNATGGSVNVITRAPEDEFDAAFEGVLGSFDTARIQGHVNIPAGNVGVRLAMAGSDGDGYIRNSIDGRRFAEEDYVGFRSSIRMQPTAALRIDVIAQHVEDDGATGDLWLPRRDQLADPNDIRLTTVTLDNPYLDTKDSFASAEVAWDFGDPTLRSITGYAYNLTRALDDCAGTPQLQGCVRGVQPLRYQQRSQELRLESTVNESLEWLVGAFYFNGDEYQRIHQTVPLISPLPINNYTATTDVTAYAVFGNATVSLGDRWSLDGGLRLSQESQRVADIGDGLADNVALVSARNSWDNTSWRLGVEYSPAADMLVFANVSTGFKNGAVTTERLPDGVLDSYDPEQLLAYEAGVSKVFPGRRRALRASAFYYDFNDMQVRTVAILANRVTSVIDNAATARIYGLDLSATVPLADRMTFSGSMVWMPNRKFVEFVDAANDNSFSGNIISRAPEWSASASIAYRVRLALRLRCRTMVRVCERPQPSRHGLFPAGVHPVEPRLPCKLRSRFRSAILIDATGT